MFVEELFQGIELLVIKQRNLNLKMYEEVAFSSLIHYWHPLFFNDLDLAWLNDLLRRNADLSTVKVSYSFGKSKQGLNMQSLIPLSMSEFEYSASYFPLF